MKEELYPSSKPPALTPRSFASPVIITKSSAVVTRLLSCIDPHDPGVILTDSRRQ